MPAQSQAALQTTFQPPPVGQLIDTKTGMATQPFLLWLNLAAQRFLFERTNFMLVTGNYQVQLNDCTMRAIITAPATVTLPDPTDTQGQFYFIKNDVTSTASVTLAAALNRLIDNAPASNIVLTNGQCVIVQSDGTNWIIICLCSGAAGGAASNSGNGNTPVPLTPSGTPSGSTPVPPGTPVVSTLPGPTDPLSVVGNFVIYQGQPYIYTDGIFGGSDYWALDTTSSPSIRDTFANLSLYPAANYRIGTVFYATDRQVSYAIQFPGGVATWIYYNGIYEAPLASIPGGLDDTSRGMYFRASDYLHNWEWTGGAWSLTAAAQSGFQGGLAPGSTVFANPGPPFGGTGALWQLCDGSTVGVSQEDGSIVATTVPTIANTWFVR